MSNHRLTYSDRINIEILYKKCMAISEIASNLGLVTSTVYREISKRHSDTIDEFGRFVYDAKTAQANYNNTMQRCGRKCKSTDLCQDEEVMSDGR